MCPSNARTASVRRAFFGGCTTEDFVLYRFGHMVMTRERRVQKVRAAEEVLAAHIDKGVRDV